jgi:hypothetical protein
MPTSETIQETTSSTGTMPPNASVDPNGCTVEGSGLDSQGAHDKVEPESDTKDDV